MFELCAFCKRFNVCEAQKENLTMWNDADDNCVEYISPGQLIQKYPFIKEAGVFFFGGGSSVIVLDCERYEPNEVYEKTSK